MTRERMILIDKVLKIEETADFLLEKDQSIPVQLEDDYVALCNELGFDKLALFPQKDRYTSLLADIKSSLV